jgi:hypothetical protein
MVSVHHAVAFAVIAATFGAAAVGGWTYYRRTEPRGLLTHLLALAQTLLVAQVGLGLLLLSNHHRAADRLHYLYGTLSLLAVLAPCSTRLPSDADGSPGSRPLPWWQERSPCGRT